MLARPLPFRVMLRSVLNHHLDQGPRQVHDPTADPRLGVPSELAEFATTTPFDFPSCDGCVDTDSSDRWPYGQSISGAPPCRGVSTLLSTISAVRLLAAFWPSLARV